MRFRNIKWNELKKICPIDIERVCDLARELKLKVNALNFNQDAKFLHKKVLEIKPLFNRLIFTFLGLIRQGVVMKDRKDWLVYFRIEQDFKNIFMTLDTLEKDKLDYNDVYKASLIRYINIIETIVTGMVYDSLYEASKAEQDRHRFLYALWEFVDRRCGFLITVRNKEGEIASIDYTKYLEDDKKKAEMEKDFSELTKGDELLKQINKGAI